MSDPTTVNAYLRARCDDLQEQLRQRDLEEHLRLAKAETDRVRAEQTAAIEAAGKKAAEDLEAHRRRSWFDHEVAECVRTQDNPRFRHFLKKNMDEHCADAPAGWAPGYSPVDYMAVPAFAKEESEEAAGTL